MYSVHTLDLEYIDFILYKEHLSNEHVKKPYQIMTFRRVI